jgi:hypothetical protein
MAQMDFLDALFVVVRNYQPPRRQEHQGQNSLLVETNETPEGPMNGF